MSLPSDHHYVPRSFFKPWANQKKEVVVYERKNSLIISPYRQSTKSICVEKGLYSYTDSIEEKQRNAIEQKLLSLVDNHAATVNHKLQNMDGSISLSDQHRYYWAVFLVSLRLRTPEGFKYNIKNAERILKEHLSIQGDLDLERKEIQNALQGKTLLQWAQKYHRDVIENYGHELMAKYFTDDKFALPIMQMHWMVLKRKARGLNLLSSDRPLVLIGSREHSNLGFAMAISPESIFLATSKLESIDKLLNTSSDKLIKNMNISTVQQARHKAFSLDKSHSVRFFQNRLGSYHNILPWAEME